jgi:nucleoside-diphosphate-sugar epimerase
VTSSREVALVTGAAGFVGREVVSALLRNGVKVRAGVRKSSDLRRFSHTAQLEGVVLDVLDARSLRDALEGADTVYHFAAVMRGRGRREELYSANVTGTANLWNGAAAHGVKRALYCSTASVYGLLAGSELPIAEDVPPKAVEPYGRAKLEGERVALEIGHSRGVGTRVIRPAAVLGPGERSAFGRAIRRAALTRLLMPGTYPHRRFSFVHVADVAAAAVHVMRIPDVDGEVFNVAVDRPISFNDAFQVYLAVLRRSGKTFWRPRMLAWLSALVQRHPHVLTWLGWNGSYGPVFPVWQLDRELVFTSRKLLATEFRFAWPDFGDVLESCMAN